MKIIHPQEIEVWYLLPAIRKELAQAMKDKGHSQKAIAEALQITPSAVSQYMNQKRATEIKFSKETQIKIIQAAENIINNPEHLVKETQCIVKQTWNEKMMCQLCHTYAQTSQECEVCFQ